MRFKRFMALGMAAIMTMSLAACGGGSKDGGADTSSSNNTSSDRNASSGNASSDNASSGNAADSTVPTYASIKLGEDYTDMTASIKFIHHKTDREGDGTMANFIAEFNKMYPNINVSTEGITDYADTALLRLPTGADWGDVMFIPTVDMVDLPIYFQPYGTVDEMSEFINFADNWKFEGNCYGIGFMANAQGLLYNKKVFADAGITDLPTTPDEFIAALQLIRDNTDATPLYTNYASGWALGGQWDALLGAITTGDTAWLNQKLTHTAEPFKDNGDGTGAYALYKILYDAVALGLTEEDYTTTDWEGCKGMINRGEIGTMVLGSWAVAQMKEAGDNPDDVAYMPFPISINGQQYATAGPDYSYGINAQASDENKTAAMVFVKWMVEESGWCDLEGGYPVSKTAPTSFSFEGVNIVENEPAPDDEADLMNQMNAESELNINNGGDSRVQAIVEAAAAGTPYDDLVAGWTKKWNDAQSALGVDVTY